MAHHPVDVGLVLCFLKHTNTKKHSKWTNFGVKWSGSAQGESNCPPMYFDSSLNGSRLNQPKAQHESNYRRGTKICKEQEKGARNCVCGGLVPMMKTGDWWLKNQSDAVWGRKDYGGCSGEHDND